MLDMGIPRHLVELVAGLYNNQEAVVMWNGQLTINVVALRQTRLVLEWVTVCGRVNHFGM